MKIKNWQISLVVIFLVAEIVFTVLAQTLSGTAMQAVEYTSICLCFVFALVFIATKKFNFIIVLGLLFTLGADACLVLNIPPKQGPGMVFFSIAQIIYAVYLMIDAKRALNIASIIVRVIGSALIVLITFLVLKDKFDFVSAISMFYIFNLVINIIFAFIQFKKHKLFAIGLVFFVLCDIFIGLACANGVYFTISNLTISKMISGNIAWLFYIPSQTLIALSTAFNNKKEAPALLTRN